MTTLEFDTAYHSFDGDVASTTPTICRLLDLHRHQLSTIALERVQQLAEANTALRAEVEVLRVENAQLRQDLTISLAQQTGKPPIINLKETEGFSFPVGEATLTREFRGKLSSEAVPAFLDAANRYNAKVIEVIGHTDEQPIVGRVSNLDQQLIPYLKTTRIPVVSVESLIPLVAGDNAGLGMARAAAVAKFLMSDSRLAEFQILPMSGAQVINTNDTIASGVDGKDTSVRRRIELRARRANN